MKSVWRADMDRVNRRISNQFPEVSRSPFDGDLLGERARARHGTARYTGHFNIAKPPESLRMHTSHKTCAENRDLYLLQTNPLDMQQCRCPMFPSESCFRTL